MIRLSIFSAAIMLLLSGVAFSTPKWWKVDSKLAFTEIAGLSAVDSLHIWAAAHPGAYVIRSMDGGWNWSQTFSGYPYYIDFVDTLKGWGVISGDPNGAIVRTTDGGQHWTIQNSTPGMSLYNLEFVDLLHGVVVGDSGFALFTSNGGINWRRSNLPISRSIMQAARVLDTGHVWVGGYGGVRDTSVVFFSSDWGQSWQPQPLLDIITETNVVTIDFLDTLNGYLFSRWGSGSASFLYRTSNGGTTWNKILSINSDNWGLRDMDATDTLHIWLAGNYFPGEAAILSSTDGGTTWDTLLTGVEGPFYNIEMIDDRRGWASGTEGLMYTYAELVRGDLDLDGNFSAADVVLELDKVFLDQAYPAFAQAGDVNCDSQFTASDVVLLLNRVFLGAPLPCTD